MRQFEWRLRGLTIAAMAAIAVACSDTPTQPPAPGGDPGLSIVAGANATDTIHALLTQALVVEVNDSRGQPLSDVDLHFANAPGQDPAYVYFSHAEGRTSSRHTLTVRTDARGLALARIMLGNTAGKAEVIVVAPALGDTATAIFEVGPGAPHSVTLSPDDTALYPGASLAVVSTVRDREGNAIAAAPSVVEPAPGGVLSYDDGRLRAERIGRGFAVATHGELADTAWISVMPRATIVAYEKPLSWAGPEGSRTGRLVLLELDGSEYRTLLAPDPNPSWDGYGPGLHPRWSPSGDEIAYISSGQLRSVDMTGATRLIAGSAVTVWHEYSPEWSASGEWIHFTSTFPWSGGPTLWRARADGSGEEVSFAEWPMPVSPGPAPVGDLLAYQTHHSFNYVIRLVDTRTGQRIALDVPGGRPRWSPTGEWIAYLGHDARLRVMRPDGSARRLVGGGVHAHGNFSWSPDGAWIVASGPLPGPGNSVSVGLVVINVASGEVLPLRLSRTVIQPSWRP